MLHGHSQSIVGASLLAMGSFQTQIFPAEPTLTEVPFWAQASFQCAAHGFQHGTVKSIVSGMQQLALHGQTLTKPAQAGHTKRILNALYHLGIGIEGQFFLPAGEEVLIEVVVQLRRIAWTASSSAKSSIVPWRID